MNPDLRNNVADSVFRFGVQETVKSISHFLPSAFHNEAMVVLFASSSMTDFAKTISFNATPVVDSETGKISLLFERR